MPVPRILIAEPSPDVRLLMRWVVARLGHEPVVLDPSMRREPRGIDALLLEPAMLGGIELAREARRLKPGLPIVICTIGSRDKAASALEPIAHLTKPFARAELERALLVALDAQPAAPAAPDRAAS